VVDQNIEIGHIIINGTFKWSDKEDFSLKNIDINIKKGELVAIIGRVASGKTSLANTILGQLKSEKSNIIKLGGTTSYVSQKPFIINDTVENNILFFNEFLFYRILHTTDLAIFFT
jgi:ABC-type multidrug transport system fused ATPase/permease subunit